MHKDILENIAAKVELNMRDMKEISLDFDGEYHIVSFDCDALHYECYIETSGEIVGFNCYPVPETNISSVA